MVRLPKIAIGTNKRQHYFDLSHDVETTADFGFCQPTVVRHVNAGSQSTLKTGIGVRLAPLPCPTFGRIRLKTYNTLVPIEEVFEAFDYFQKGTSVTSIIGSYIPKEAPYIPAYTLRDFIIMQSLTEWQKLTDSTGDLERDTDINAFLNFTYATPSISESNLVFDRMIGETKLYKFANIEMSAFGSALTDSNLTEVTRSVYDGLIFAMASAQYLNQGTNFWYATQQKITQFWDIPVDTVSFQDKDFSGLNRFNQFPIAIFDGSRDERLDATRRAYYCNRATSASYDMFLGYNTVTVEFTNAQNEACQIQVPIALLCNWTKRGQRLFKVLNACGLKGFIYNDNVDMCKVYAYYKAWFDQLNPGRNQQWKETVCYKFIHSFYDYPEQLLSLLFTGDGEYTEFADAQRDFSQFLVDLSNCCYVLPVDNFTAATPQPLLQQGSIEVPIVTVGSATYELHQGSDINNYPFGVPTDGLGIKSLMHLYHLANKNSVIGARIEDYLRTKYGYIIKKSNILHGAEMSVKIDEIFATAGTSDNYLGEIGGRGSTNNGDVSKIKFTADKPSIFVQFVAIVPLGDYVQGNVRAKVVKNDFYQEAYDSLGKEALGMSEIMARSSDLTYGEQPKSYGFVPMYWRDKVQNSLHNGAFALPSQRALLLPYSLDRVFNETKQVLKSNPAPLNNIYFERDEGTKITPSEELRYIGRTPDYGNYDRIFFDNSGYYDNFILHIVQDWDYYATMKPISQSFDTYDDDDESTTTITAS